MATNKTRNDSVFQYTTFRAGAVAVEVEAEEMFVVEYSGN